MNYLLVDMYNDFQCIAGDCPNTCCVGWGIYIDEKTYQKMKAREEELGVSVSDWITGKEDHRSVKMDNYRRCPMLDEKNLCKIVQKLGQEYLSVVCTVYPRIQKKYGNVYEGYLSLSCPEAVSMLLKKTAVEFDLVEDENSILQNPYLYEELYLYESAARTGMVEIFQYPADISLHTRIAAAFDLLEKAIRLYKEGNTDYKMLQGDAVWYLQEDRLVVMDRSLRGIINEENRYHFLQQMQMLLEEDEKEYAEHFISMLEKVKAYFARKTPEQYAGDARKFKNIQCTYQDFYIRYWIYCLFSKMISIPDYGKARTEFMCIAASFCLIQSMALAIYADEGVLEEHEYIYIISNISRTIEHDSGFHKKLEERLNKNRINGLAGLLLLV